MTTFDAIRAYHDELTTIRRDIHVHPEMGFEEHRTSDLVAAIQAHQSSGSEANTIVQRFNALSVAQQQDLLNFLRSL